MADFASRLRELRKTRNLRQVDLARVLKVAQTTIANYEQHTRFPDENTLRRIADYFDVSLDYLLGRVDVQIDASRLERLSGDVRHAGELNPLAGRYLQTMLAGDAERAENLIEDAYADGYSAEELYLDVFEPVLYATGSMWESGDIGVAEEHIMSEVTMRLMHRFSLRLSRTGATRGTVVAATAAGELHVLGLRMVCDFLQADGWHVVFLGTHVPANTLLRAASRHGADLLALSVNREEYLEPLSAMIGRLRRADSKKQRRIMVGGEVFRRNPKLYRQVGADASARDAAEAVETAARLWEAMQHRRA